MKDEKDDAPDRKATKPTVEPYLIPASPTIGDLIAQLVEDRVAHTNEPIDVARREVERAVLLSGVLEEQRKAGLAA